MNNDYASITIWFKSGVFLELPCVGKTETEEMQRVLDKSKTVYTFRNGSVEIIEIKQK